MLNKSVVSLSLGLLTAVSFAVKAAPATSPSVLVAPSCLIQHFTAPHKILSSTNKLVLIETNEMGIQQLNAAKHQQKKCGGFMDVTGEWNDFKAGKATGEDKAKAFLLNQEKPAKPARVTQNLGYSIKYETEVKALLGKLVPQNMWNDLVSLTNFTNRNANSDYGINAAEWIKTQIETIAKETGHNDVTAYFVETCKKGSDDKCTTSGKNYKQPSVVAKFGTGTGPGIVIGGHMDTDSWSSNRQPGADDDGTGSVTVLETARVLLSSGMKFNKPIYFVWYAAEEKGLVGSQYVVEHFKRKNIPVDAVIQFDMTGFENDRTMWLVNDYVNTNLTKFLGTLISTYVKQPFKLTECGYACSDHASWHKGGFNASMPFESSFEEDNKAIHSANDTMDKLSLNHMTDYAKLGIAFAVELAEPVA